MPGVDHLDLVVTDLERSLAFYTELLGPLGFTETSEIVGERGERVIYISGAGDPEVSLRERKSDAHAVPYDRYAVGIHHVAFEVDDLPTALQGHRVIIEPNSPSVGVTAAFTEVNGAPVELQIDHAARPDL